MTFYDKSSEERMNRRNIPQYNKGYSQHCPKGGKTETITSKVRNKKRFLLSPFLFNTVLELLTRTIGNSEKWM
jgi:hypothetical protein